MITQEEADRHVGQRLRQLRRAHGMSQTKLGEMLGLSFQQVQKYERGINRIGSGRLWQISRMLDVPITYFFEGMATDDAVDRGPALETGDPGYGSGGLPRNTLKLARALNEIPDTEVKAGFLRLIKAFTKAG
jgi:transcriptional regulator with XRE-family HTH domain